MGKLRLGGKKGWERGECGIHSAYPCVPISVHSLFE